MAGRIRTSLKHAWNAFKSQEDKYKRQTWDDYGGGGSHVYQPSRTRFSFSNERSIISSIYTRLSIDIASVEIRHVRLDEKKRYLEDMNSHFNECLTVEANLDQAARRFRQDIALSLFDNGSVAIVPVDTTLNPETTGGFDIKSLRVGRITDWYPRHVKVEVYNDHPDVGDRQEIILEKKFVAIIENPLYSVMNEHNSTLQRLIRKLNLLDSVDEQSASGKLDLIIQLPYVIKSEAKRDQAEKRRKDIEFQLKGSQYGIAYTDGTEKITQLNRPAENNLMGQVQYLTEMLYAQLGLTEEVMNGTANEAAMLNYRNRTVEPVVSAIVEAMCRSFLTKTARSQGQSVMFFIDPFKLVPIGEIAEIADKFVRNEIATSNELRQAIGWAPSQDPKADELHNSNMPREDSFVSDGDEAAEKELDRELDELGI